MSIRSLWPYLAAFAVCAALSLAIYVPVLSPYPYPYDSADYIYAGKLGFWANYVDKGALSLPEFIRQGLELKNNPSKRSEMSRVARATDDPHIYRHYHGPLYFLFLHAVERMGVRGETGFRAAGLAAHSITALLVALAFWSLFPLWPKAAGLLAATLYLFNRTAIVTAAEITQHVAFLFTMVLALWMMSLFCRRLETRYFYATMASLALAFSAVETAALLAVTFAAVLVVLYRPIAEKWPSWRERAGVLLRGAGVFVAALFVLWPAGVFKLSLLRGFVYLAYIALARKTFSPTGPLDTWVARFTASPWEHWPLFIGFIAALVLWRRLEHRREALPWLAYAFVFIVVTTKVTVDYVHYRGSLALVWTMATAIVVGHLWKQRGSKAGIALAAVLLACSAMETARHRTALKASIATPTSSAHVLSWVKGAGIPPDRKVLVPYYFVPALHLYHPEVRAVGYDVDWPVDRLAAEVRSPESHTTFLCIQSMCEAVEKAVNGSPAPKKLVAPVHDREPLYAMTVPR